MKKFNAVIYGFFIFSLFVFVPSQVWSAPAHVPNAPAAQTSLTPISDELQKQLQSLVAPASSANSSSEEGDDTNVEPTPTFGSRALNFIISIAGIAHDQGEKFFTNFNAWPQLSTWLNQQQTDQHLRNRWIAIGQDFINYILFPLLGAVLLELLLFPVRLYLRHRNPQSFSGRLSVVWALFCLRAIPILVFVGVAASMLDQNETQKLPRFILFNIVYAFTLIRITLSFLRGMFAPLTPTLRILPMTDEQAVYSQRWLNVLAVIIIGGYFFHDVAIAVHIPADIIAASGNTIGLMLVGMMIAIIIQKRDFISSLLRGQIATAQHALSPFQSLRLWFARRWHMLAITYLVIGYMIAALGVANGLVVMMRGTILTFLILIAVRLLLGAVDRWTAAHDKTTLGTSIFGGLYRTLVWLLAIVGSAMSWGVDVPALFATTFGQRVLGALFSITLTMVVLTSFYEVLSRAIDRHMNRRREEDDALRSSARIRTLLPMIRNGMFALFAAVFGLVLLSELGVNVAPLLAGAGILGVAVGFGSQTLVKDFLTGFFIIIENTIAIGDYIKIGDQAGTVESISLRTVRLREYDGSFHVVPFSDVTKITNVTKDFGYAVISVGVAYDTDLDRAMELMRSIGADLQEDPIYKRMILEPMEMWGVDKLGDSSITLMGRIRTRPGKQHDVRRAYLLRLKKLFDKEGIVIPYPTVMNIIQKPQPEAHKDA